jgi:translocation and assembly module TamB
MECNDDNRPIRPRRRWRPILLGGIAILMIGAGIAWSQRTRLATSAIDSALAKRGVAARYRITTIGPQWQRVEDVVIGDPTAPDLTAKWIELRLATSLQGVRVTEIRASGVRMRGQYADGALKLGEIDKLLPKGKAGKPFSFPVMRAALHDIRVVVKTPVGTVATRIDGRGNLGTRFAGTVAAVIPRLSQRDCAGDRITAFGPVTIDHGAVAFKGPMRAAQMQCGATRIAGLSAAVDLMISNNFNNLSGLITAKADTANGAGLALSTPTGETRFSGPLRALTGQGRLNWAKGSHAAFRMAEASITGQYRISDGGLANDIRANGTISVARFEPTQDLNATILSSARASKGTPLAPILNQFGAAVAEAGKHLSISADTVFANGILKIPRINATSTSGFRAAFTGEKGVMIGASGMTAMGQLTMAGGGFPSLSGTIERQPQGQSRGTITIAPYQAGLSRIAPGPIRFAGGPDGGMRIGGMVRLDGPIAGGRISGLSVPLDIVRKPNGDVIVNQSCTQVAINSMVMNGLILNANRIVLCPARNDALLALRKGVMTGDIRIASPRLTGKIGDSPILLTAIEAQIATASRALNLRDVALKLGPSNRQTALSIGTLSGSLTAGTASGRFAKLAGQIGAVPLRISNSTGQWRFKRGALGLSGALTVSDTDAEPRFYPLISRDFTLSLSNGRIEANGLLRNPDTDIGITTVALRHDLASARGSAILNVPRLQFGQTLRPDQLTRLTTGIVQNVEGAISGQGTINWTANGVTSGGTFQTEDGGIDLAAAFGPVEGMRGKIIFDDLLALTTPADQAIFIDTINTGVPVLGGTVAYQLLPDRKIAVQQGSWPLAGGQLTLLPTTLDMGQPVERRMTFRVIGLDAAKFVQQLEFENLSATGIFDGDLPMVFDEKGGRIEGGALKVRREGGLLAYVGDVSNAEMNIFGRMAFDSLKSMRYRDLTIELGGPLDGEIISLVRFDGTNRTPIEPTRNFFARQFIGLPFRFNITIRAPFRQLISTARGFTDPLPVIQRALPLPEALPGQDSNLAPKANPVKPSESGQD